MALTAAEEARIDAIEKVLNELQIAINNLVSKRQVNMLLLVKQDEIDTLKTRVDQLETQLTTLQNRI